MKKTTIRNLHLNTGAIVKEANAGQVFIIERHGIPVAELRPLQPQPRTRPLPDRRAFLSKFPRIKADSGRILEEDRS
jgi:antitoxin (DNA-binding transcriptional repressor) of toxin-antitoxin stability system